MCGMFVLNVYNSRHTPRNVVLLFSSECQANRLTPLNICATPGRRTDARGGYRSARGDSRPTLMSSRAGMHMAAHARRWKGTLVCHGDCSCHVLGAVLVWKSRNVAFNGLSCVCKPTEGGARDGVESFSRAITSRRLSTIRPCPV